MSQHMREQQISVPLPAALREFVEREAEKQDRSLAGVIRRFVAAAAVAQAERRAQFGRGASELSEQEIANDDGD
jgi:hypothetical protein